MQPVMRRRRAAWRTFHTEFGWKADPGRDWQCQSGGSNENDPLCPPARADLGAPVIQSAGYQNQERRSVFAAVMSENGVTVAEGVSVGGSGSGNWPPGPAPTGLKHPWEPDPPYGGDMATPLPCPIWYETWDHQAQACVEIERPQCWPEKPYWNWDYWKCQATPPGEPDEPAPATTPLLALPLGDVGHYGQRRTDMSHGYSANDRTQFFGTATPRRRRMARALAAGADARHGFAVGYGHSSNDNSGYDDYGNPSRVMGTMLPGGQGWVRTTPIHEYAGVTGASAKSASSVRRYNMMARQRAGLSVGVSDASVTSARAVRRYNLMTHSRAGMSVGMHGDQAHRDGVFYGFANPLREAERRRAHPTGYQHGFAVGRGCGY